jgi:quinol monooxygenase YgiN
MPMVIIAGHVEVDPAERDGYVHAMQDLVGRCRRAVGCLDVAITTDGLDLARVNILERWDCEEHLEAWRAHADPPDTGVEIVAENVSLFVVAEERPPFG